MKVFCVHSLSVDTCNGDVDISGIEVYQTLEEAKQAKKDIIEENLANYGKEVFAIEGEEFDDDECIISFNTDVYLKIRIEESELKMNK